MMALNWKGIPRSARNNKEIVLIVCGGYCLEGVEIG